MARMPVRMRPSDPFFSSRIQDCNLVACVFKFVDLTGCVLHTIDDPEDQLPNPRIQAGSFHRAYEDVGDISDAQFNQPTNILRSRANSGERLSR